MLKLLMSKKMKKDIRRCEKRGFDLQKLVWVTDMLCAQKTLPPKYKDHPLTGEWQDFRECHIENDWLLIYQIFEEELILSAIRTRTHSDLFR